jgi:hypothetical protein
MEKNTFVILNVNIKQKIVFCQLQKSVAVAVAIATFKEVLEFASKIWK